MMFSRFELDFNKKNNVEDEKKLDIARERYLHKFTHHPKEIKRLCLHEKEFLFRYMTAIIIKDESLNLNLFESSYFESPYKAFKFLESNGVAKKAYDLYTIEASYEYLFNTVILNHFPYYRFCSPVKGAHGLLEPDEILKDKEFFEYYMPIWIGILESGKGSFATHLKVEYDRKIKILNGYRKSNFIGNNFFVQKKLHIQLALYHIYYIIKHFFDAEKYAYYRFEIGEDNFIFDIYSYVHILSRHYMPDINSLDFKKSFNSDLPFIDIWYLPNSVKELLINYNQIQQFGQNRKREFIIFQSKSEYYILWLRYEFIDSIKEKGYHIRTLYKIKDSKDLEKIHSLEKIKFNNDITFFVN